MKIRIILSIILICFLSSVKAQWHQTSFDCGNYLNCLAISGGNILAGTNLDGIYKSSDNGNTWNLVNSGLPDTIFLFVESMVVKGSFIFAGIDNAGIYMSSNNGSNWIPCGNNGLNQHAYPRHLAVSGSNIVAGTFNGIFISSDNGNNWSQVTNGLPPNKFISSLAASGSSIVAGTDSGRVFLSTDNGNSWALANNGLPANFLIYSLAINGNNIFAGTYGGGVYYSSNSGTNWTAVNNGLLTIYPFNALIFNGNNIIAGSFGVFQSSNYGDTWISSNAGLADSAVLLLTIKGDTLIAGTTFPSYEGSFIWMLPLSELGLNEMNNDGSIISVYPNPAKNIITIKLPFQQHIKNSIISIYNIHGQKILQQSLKQEKTDIDISEFTRGIYLINIRDDNQIEVIKIVKE